MTENYMVCNCKQVSYSTIVDAIQNNTKFDDVLKTFESVQKITNCSTGCGGCHQKVLDIISKVMSGAEI
ncbi:MAG: (2Fe-2S)-binding protein [Ruminococcaceae bacterium]|nr:(2Fe-2S)-binding protein [Oscillospiraceae bacterium]